MTAQSVTVRMYNVGFGDCFLVRFAHDDGQASSVLIDCGTHSAGKGPVEFSKVVETVIEQLRGTDGSGPAVDVVVGTHRHRDHVHGFTQALWNSVSVKEVWMPWTEHPTNPPAVRLREKQSAAALSLMELSAAPFAVGPRWEATAQLALNSLKNEKAMRTLHSGFVGSPSRWFLPTSVDDVPAPDEDRSVSFTTPVLPGVVVHVLGPSRDEKVIRDMDPPKEEAFLRLALRAGSDAAGLSRLPFAAWKWSDSDALKTKRLFETYYPHLRPPSKGRLVKAGEVDPYVFAVALEQAVNGTSLMLMFEFGDAFLLFPGDAQWGTWDAALDDPARRELLGKTTFYKVGHHGSHNATPRVFVEEVMAEDPTAMVSVAPTSIESWADIPKSELLEALTSRTRKLIRSDQQAPLTPADHPWLEETISA